MKEILIKISASYPIKSIEALISVIKKKSLTEVKNILYKTKPLCQQSVNNLKV